MLRRFPTMLFLLLATSLTWLPPAAQAQTQTQLALSHVAPEDCVFFLSWKGWSKPDASSQNRTEKLFAEESLQEFCDQLSAEIDKLLERATQGDEQAAVVKAAVTRLLKTAATHPTVFYLASFTPKDDPEIDAALVVDAGADAAEAIQAIKNLIGLAPKDGSGAAVEEQIGGGTFYRPQERGQNAPDIRVGYRKSHLIMTFGMPTLKHVLARLDKPGNPPAWLTQVSKELSVPRPCLQAHFNIERLMQLLQPVITDPQAPRILTALGVSDLKYVATVAGLDATGMQINTAVMSKGAPKGLFDLLGGKPLTRDDLRKIPANAVNATVARCDLADLYEKALNIAEQIAPIARQQAEQGLAQAERQLGFSVKNDLLQGFGDLWTFYTSGSEAGAALIPGIVLTISVRDQAKLAKVQDQLVNMARGILAQMENRAPFALQDFSARGEKGYRIQINNLPLPISPTWVLTKDQFVLGITPQLVSGHLAGVSKGSLADSNEIKQAFEWNSKPTFVSYSDPKPGLQGLYTLINSFAPLALGQLAQQGIQFNLPPLPPISDLEQHLAPTVTVAGRTENGWRSESHGVIPSGIEVGPAAVAVGVALLLPAVQQAREAARRSQTKNNLKQIAIAMHNYQDVFRSFPAAASTNKDGKPLLSWRVHILPFVEQNQLYQQFHLDEPWDSEHNKRLIESMPQVFASPNDPALAKQGKTRYLAVNGTGFGFEGTKPVRIQDFTDGTSNTILAVEATSQAAVIWTKPDDLNVDLEQPLKDLKGARPGGFHAMFCDGSVRFISENINLNTLKALFTRAGGEVVGDF